MTGFKILDAISIHRVAAEWDDLAPVRLKQILGGSDITFNNVILPNILSLISDVKTGSALDAGCGVGVITDYLSGHFYDVIGVDPSRVSIDLARRTCPGAEFYSQSIEEYQAQSKRKFDLVVANMVLMDAPDIFAFCQAVSALLKPSGSFVFSITHPSFWPEYYGYSRCRWYSYSEEIIIQSPFRISTEQDCRFSSTHIHRPLEKYFSAITEAGLVVDLLSEPFPDHYVQSLYPKPWRNPRYLLARCKRRRRA